MAIAYKSQGAGVVTEASGGALSPLCPATVDAGDILIAHCAYEGTSTTPDTPSGWTPLGGPYTVETAYRHWIFGKIAAGTEDGAAVAFGTPAVTTLRCARVYSFSGRVDGTITALVPAAGFAHLSHATDPQMPTVTTTVAGALAVACTFQADDNPQASATGATGGTWAEAVAEYVQAATTPDTALHIQTCTPTADPGTVTGGTVATLNDPCGVIGFEIKPTAAQTVSPSAIATGEAFGTAQLNQQVVASGIATAEAFGTSKVNQSIVAAAITSAEAFGTAELTQGVGGQTVTASAIDSEEALGTPQLNLKISPDAIASTETFGTSKLNLQLNPTGIQTAEALGAPSANFTISMSGIASTETFGSPALGLMISPSGIASAEASGTAQLNLQVSPTGISSEEAFGTPELPSGGITPSGIASLEAFGTPKLNRTLPAGSIASAEAFGNPTVYDYLYAPEEPAPEEPPVVDDSVLTLPDGSRFTRTLATGATGASPIYARLRVSRSDPERVRIQLAQDGALLSLKGAAVSVVCQGGEALAIERSGASVVVKPMACPRILGLRHLAKVRIEYPGGRILWIPIGW